MTSVRPQQDEGDRTGHLPVELFGDELLDQHRHGGAALAAEQRRGDEEAQETGRPALRLRRCRARSAARRPCGTCRAARRPAPRWRQARSGRPAPIAVATGKMAKGTSTWIMPSARREVLKTAAEAAWHCRTDIAPSRFSGPLPSSSSIQLKVRTNMLIQSGKRTLQLHEHARIAAHIGQQQATGSASSTEMAVTTAPSRMVLRKTCPVSVPSPAPPDRCRTRRFRPESRAGRSRPSAR